MIQHDLRTHGIAMEYPQMIPTAEPRREGVPDPTFAKPLGEES